MSNPWNAPEAQPAAPGTPTSGATTPPPQTLRFNGRGGEYFGIWIVNLLLTILTLGIYSAWAKVRRLQYFYRATELDGSSFDYHGKPLAILKGRLIALGLLLAYQFAARTSPILLLVVLGLLLAIGPWLLWNSFRFRFYNSSYRGLRFGFDGTVGGAYLMVLKWIGAFAAIGVLMALAIASKSPLLIGVAAVALIPLYLFAVVPYWYRELKNYEHANARYGQTPFSFGAGLWDFSKIYLVTFLLMIGIVVLGGILAGVVGGAGLATQLGDLKAGAGSGRFDPRVLTAVSGILVVFYLGLFLLIGPFFVSRMQNMIWNNTRLGPHRLESTLHARGLLGVYFINLIGMIFTLGLFYPWAMVRLAKYRVEHLSFVAGAPLEDFAAGRAENPSALGAEAAGMFDIDISL